MFSNAGKKIKSLVKLLYWLEISIAFSLLMVFLYAILRGQYLLASMPVSTVVEQNNYLQSSISVIIKWLICFFSYCYTVWIKYVLLYGYGQLIENTDRITECLRQMDQE